MWSIMKHAATYRNRARRCHLCFEEKLLIMKADKRNLLNKRAELADMHQNQFDL